MRWNLYLQILFDNHHFPFRYVQIEILASAYGVYEADVMWVKHGL